MAKAARREARGAESPDAYDAVFTALAHPARRRILMTLYFEGGSMTAGAIAEIFESAWPTTTRHLGVLADAGLVQHSREGRTRVYRIVRDRLALVRDWLAWFSKDTGCTRDEVPPPRREGSWRRT